MTTSITDGRYTSLHFTTPHLHSLSFDESPETGWSVMPGFDEDLPIPSHLEPIRADMDETLPSMMHPSYPLGRGATLGRRKKKGGVSGSGGVGNLLGSVEWSGRGEGEGEGWVEMGMRGVVEVEKRREVPPGMAGAKRPPSPPSPALRPLKLQEPRSVHLRNLYARLREAETVVNPGFDAPVPNETYAPDDAGAGGQGGELEGGGVGGGGAGVGVAGTGVGARRGAGGGRRQQEDMAIEEEVTDGDADH